MAVKRTVEEEILDAATEVFARLGFAGTRVEDILEAAGVARRTFYKHFEGKEAVLAALYQSVTQQLLQTIVDGGPVADPIRGVQRALEVYFDFHLEHARLLHVIIEQAVRSESPLAPLRRQFRSNLFELIDAAVFMRTARRHPRVVYVGLISALEGITMDLLAGRPTRAQVSEAKEVMWSLMERTLGLDVGAPGG